MAEQRSPREPRRRRNPTEQRRPAAAPLQEAVDLTPRETEILTLISDGLSNPEICDRLWLSMPTVKTHIGHLLAKTHSRDRVQLVLYALRSGAVPPD
ncbi:MAG: helix-turn-helix transcriptional regulator [Propionibacteriales bacterium]|nr:helix-turn-helix transcriptional regulator [Propionibacteriales bacterium]